MDERYRLIMESEHIGTAERTDALLDECEGIRRELDDTPSWRVWRRSRLGRDLLAYQAELSNNERIRARRASRVPLTVVRG